MSPAISLLIALGLGLAGWLVARRRAYRFLQESQTGRIAALPNYHGWYAALWIAVPMVLFLLVWEAVSGQFVLAHALASPEARALPDSGLLRDRMISEAYNLASGASTTAYSNEARALAEPFREAMLRYDLIGLAIAVIIAGAGAAWAFLRLRPEAKVRTRVERIVLLGLLLASLVAILTTLGIFVTLVFETFRFFGMISPIDFLFGAQWNPDPMSNAANPDPNRYGAIPLFWGTLFIGAIIAMIVAIPFGLMSAIYLTQYARPRLRRWVKPALEILAGVPTVVYGYFAALTVAPAIRDLALSMGVDNPSSESALAAGLVMGIMIIPFVSSMADDSIAAVPQSMRDGSLAVGATTNETIRRVLVPAALPGIVAGVMLAVSRAIGETMIVVMAASTAANLTGNPLEAMTTVTVQIVALLTGEGSFDHPATLAAFALGFVLFLVTLALNFIALRVVRRFREAYE
ncbi:phosphate ABC transporter permease subunit PstC [Aurantiacibacter spongiae]|uniref:Phosphate transport system permease protein n=1 Tax=Aurantiacibacter spongiae TaxID=2488860 RepID=A0A3N5D7A8_9SPHN|nr:phosphate ABC transporter permease subunit PstC [Aurantiacibacter spongiae]RPF70408.1 phosphate ABC transporter permease subunit PstC [Aurantiacibacter spongiae]